MARKTSYNRMYREYDVKEFEKNITEPPKKEEVKEDVIPEVKEDVIPEVKEEKKPSFIGTVIGGASLNVRKNPNGDIITSIKEGTQIVIVDESNTDWYKIESPEGYVMKKFVKI